MKQTALNYLYLSSSIYALNLNKTEEIVDTELTASFTTSKSNLIPPTTTADTSTTTSTSTPIYNFSHTSTKSNKKLILSSKRKKIQAKCYIEKAKRIRKGLQFGTNHPAVHNKFENQFLF